MNRVVAVSNRVAQPKRRQAGGGLAIGVLGALQQYGGLWFGWNGKVTSSGPQDPALVVDGNITYATIDLRQADLDGYYNGFSNTILWPLFHYLLGFFEYQRWQFDAYLRVNRLFARKLLPLLQPDDLIWVHDYHLIPLAGELRRAGVTQPIGFFLHTPFPSYDLLRALPPHAELLRALCAYDVVGFQTDYDLRSFLGCLEHSSASGQPPGDRRVHAHGRIFVAEVFPIGIDTAACAGLAEDARDSQPVRRTHLSLGGRRMIIGVDRLDYSKGLPERFRAYQRLLENYPDNRNEITLLQIAPPTRLGVRAYDDIRNELEQLSGHINGQFTEMDWVPIRYLHRAINRATLMGLMRISEIGLVTPLRDGMNLVAKEFVAAQDPRSPGVLVLSTMAGAARELTDAVLVNPFDLEGVAEGIQKALHMPVGERRERHQAMMRVLEHNDIHAWRTRFIEALRQAGSR